MAGFQDNLLMRLHKWAVRQDENFLTETFAYLLEFLAEHEPEAAAEIVSRITGGIIVLPPQHMRVLEVRTQITGEEGIPDIELRTGQHFVIIEVKSEAQATEQQLHRYRRLLDQAPVASKGLIFTDALSGGGRGSRSIFAMVPDRRVDRIGIQQVPVQGNQPVFGGPISRFLEGEEHDYGTGHVGNDNWRSLLT